MSYITDTKNLYRSSGERQADTAQRHYIPFINLNKYQTLNENEIKLDSKATQDQHAAALHDRGAAGESICARLR